jgi:hypothetical protein
MKQLLLIVAAFIFTSCGKDHTGEITHNVDMKIVSINSETSISADKHHKPQLCNTVLFVTVKEPILYREINTCEMAKTIHIDTKWLYNHKPNDVVHFEYLRKDLFFEIKQREVDPYDSTKYLDQTQQ